MQSNSVNGQPDIANITVVTDERQVIVPQPITSVVEVNNPGPQGPVGPTGPQGPSVPFTNIGNDVYATTSSLQVTGSFTVSGSSTFTNIGPAVFSGSTSLVGATTMSSALVSGNVTVLGTASINVLQINTTINSTGSNQLGDSANDTQTLYGSVIVPTGSLVVSGSITSVTPTNGTSGLIVRNPVDAGSSTYAAQFKDALGRDNVWIKSYSVGAGAYTGEMYINNILNIGYATYINGPSIKSYYNNLLSIQDGFGPTYIGGNVGVRMSTPSASLHVSGSGSTPVFRLDTPSTPYAFLVTSNGSVGINESSPSYALQVRGGIYQTNTSFTNFFDGTVRFGGLNSWPVAILNTGTVGIGTITPSASLHISGSSGSALLRVDSPASSSILYVSGSGFVGVGTNNPVYKLDVSNPTGYSAIGIQTAASTNAEINFKNAAYSLPRWTIRASAAADGASGNLVFQRFASTFPMTITSGDNVLIGTTTDAGYKLDVSGSGRFTSNLTITGSATISNILTLTPQSPLPSGVATGSFAVSSSVPPKPYFYDGATWNALY